MEAIVELGGLEEISCLVLDSEKKINTKFISNTYNINLFESSKLLEKWISDKKGTQKIEKEYLVKGTDNNGNSVITIVPEKRLPKAKANMKFFVSSLYSIETPSNCRKLDIPDRIECKVITLSIDDGERDISSSPEITQNTEKITAISGKSTIESKPKKIIEVKPSTSKNVSTMFSNQIKKDKEKDIKLEINKEKEKSISPKKNPIKIEPTPKKSNGTKPQKNPAVKSIASFFSNSGKQNGTSVPKPKQNVVENVENDEIEIKKEPKSATKNQESDLTPENKSKPEPRTYSGKKNKLTDAIKKVITEVKAQLSDSDSSCIEVKVSSPPPKYQKKTINSFVDSINGSDDSDSDKEVVQSTPIVPAKKAPTKKRQKKNTAENGNLKKKSRIVVNEDSTDDDEIIESSFVEEEKKLPLKLKHEKNIHSPPRKRNKAKRMVSKTYEDRDGFIRTVREMEEYSCSDEDLVIVETPKSVKLNNDKNGEKPKLKSPPKKQTTPQSLSKQKQGSIKSFFAKK